MKKLFFFLTFLFFLSILSFSAYFFYFLPQTQFTHSFDLNIEKGMNLKEVSSKISSELNTHSIQSSFLYYYLRFQKLGSKLKTGQYHIESGHTLKSIVQKLSTEGEKLKFTIPEGYNVEDIAKLLEQKQIISAARFKELAFSNHYHSLFQLDGKGLEGYLFPDTYEYHPKIKEEEIIEKMLKNFKLKAQTKLNLASPSNHLSSYEKLILASIVEKETGKAEERPLIAAVFLNRLKIGMPLATDPSVIYGVPNFDGNLRKSDLQKEGPYNTYLRKGLPPTPIANPGLASIEAVLKPSESSYLFFVAKGDGSHYFSTTYEEHKAAVEKYQINPHN